MALLLDLLGELGDRMGFPRDRLVVALGMLGETVEFERAVPDGTDHDAAAAWALAVLLSDWNGVEEVMKEGQREASGSAQRTLETALRRLQSDYMISAIS